MNDDKYTGEDEPRPATAGGAASKRQSEVAADFVLLARLVDDLLEVVRSLLHESASSDALDSFEGIHAELVELIRRARVRR